MPESRWFESKSLAARLIIMIAGVTMNVLLAFVVLTGIGMYYGEVVIPTRVVGAVHVPTNAPTLAALVPGDTITAVNGRPVANWNQVREVHRTQRRRARLRYHARSDGVVDRALPAGAGQPSGADIGNAIDFFIPPVIGDILPGSAASRAGLKSGDTVVAIAHAPLHSWSDLQTRVMPSAGKELVFDIRRAGGPKSFTIKPEPVPQKDPVTRQMAEVGKIGATPADFSGRQPMGFATAVGEGARQTWFTATKIFDVVHGLITREVSVRQLGGPIAITRASVAAAQSGLESLFLLIAVLSVNVAVLNLLPIPILDGGQIVINVAESVKGSPFSARTREYILRFGLVAILLIFAMSTFNDVAAGVKDVVAKLFG